MRNRHAAPQPSRTWRAPPVSPSALHPGIERSGSHETGDPRQGARRRALDRLPADAWPTACAAARSQTIGIISNDSFGRFTIPIVEALEERLADEGIAVFMCNATDDPSRERQHLDQLLRKRIDGLVVTARRADTRPPVGPFAHGLPVVYVFSHADDPGALCLLPDDEGGAVLAVEHLAALGRRRIAHVTGPEHFEAVRLRRSGWRAALAAAGLPELPGFYLPGVWSEAWGREAIARLFDATVPPDALFCGNDQIARGAADALRERVSLTARRCDRRLRQLGGDGTRRPAAAVQRRHEPPSAGPRGRRQAARYDRRPAHRRHGATPVLACGATVFDRNMREFARSSSASPVGRRGGVRGPRTGSSNGTPPGRRSARPAQLFVFAETGPLDGVKTTVRSRSPCHQQPSKNRIVLNQWLTPRERWIPGLLWPATHPASSSLVAPTAATPRNSERNSAEAESCALQVQAIRGLSGRTAALVSAGMMQG